MVLVLLLLVLVLPLVLLLLPLLLLLLLLLTSGDPKVTGWPREMMDTQAMLHLARRGCWAYPVITT